MSPMGPTARRHQRSLAHLLRCVICGCALLYACGPKLLYVPHDSVEGSEWRQPGGRAHGRSLQPRGPDPPLQVAWRRRFGGVPLGGPLLDGPSVLLTGETSVLRVVRAREGTLVGKVTLPEGICAWPVLAGMEGELVVMATATDKRSLLALDRRTGKVRWSREMAVCAPVTSRHDTLVVAGEAGVITVLAAPDGAQLWQWRGEGRLVASAAIGGDTVYVGDAVGNVTALDLSTGEPLWQGDLGEGIRTRPSVEAGQVLVGTAASAVVALRACSGEVVWQRRLEGLLAPGIALAPNVVVAGSSDHYLYGLDRATGEVLWRFETDGVIGSSPACTPTTAYAASTDGFVYALDVDTGALQWRYQLDGSVTGAVALGDGSMSVATAQGSLYFFVEEMQGVGYP